MRMHKLLLSWLKLGHVKEQCTLDEGELFEGEGLLVVHRAIFIDYLNLICI